MEKSILCALLSIFLFLFVRSTIAQEEVSTPDLEQLVQKLLSLKAIYGAIQPREEEHKYNGDVTAISGKNGSNDINKEEKSAENDTNKVEEKFSNKEEKSVNSEEKMTKQTKLRHGGLRFPLLDALAGYAENLTQHPSSGGGLDMINAANIGSLGNLGLLNPERLQSLSLFNPERFQSLGLLSGSENFGQLSKNMVNTLQSSPLGTAFSGSNFKKIAEGFLNPTNIFNRDAAKNV